MTDINVAVLAKKIEGDTMIINELANICEQVKREPTVTEWYCGNPPRHIVNGKTLCTLHANKLRIK